MYRICYFGDLHADKKFDKFLNSFHQILNHIKSNPPNLIIIPGDVFDGPLEVGPLYNSIVECIQELANWAPVFIVYGTPSHDFKGALEIFSKLNAENAIKVVSKPEVVYFTASGKYFCSSPEDGCWKSRKDTGLVLYGFPYPIKSRFLTDEELKLPYKEQDKLYNDRMSQWCKARKEDNANFYTQGIPTLLVAHLQLEGSIPSYKQDLQSECQKVEWFDGIALWGCIGHIHNSKLYGSNLQYTGSIYNKTRGEREDKYFYELVIHGTNTTNIQHKLVTPKLEKILCNDIEEYRKYKEVDWGKEGKWDLWFIVKASDRHQLDTVKEEEWWKSQDFIDEIKIDLDLAKTEATYRTEKYDLNATLLEKFLMWCTARNKVPTDFQKNRIKELV